VIGTVYLDRAGLSRVVPSSGDAPSAIACRAALLNEVLKLSGHGAMTQLNAP